MQQSSSPTYNFLVPADGTTHEVTFAGSLSSGTPVVIDWSSFVQAYFPFRPQAAKINNTGGTGTLTITNVATGETSSCPEGASRWVSFCSTAGLTQQISGSGTVAIQFVDWPAQETLPVDVTGTPLGNGGTVYVENVAGTSLAVTIDAGSNTIGNVGLNSGTNTIGNVGLNSGTNTIGNVVLAAGSNSVGSVSINESTFQSVFSETSVSVGTTSGTLLASGSYKYLAIQTGSEAIQINFGSTAATTSDFTIPANSSWEPAVVPSNGINAIASAATSVVVITG